MSRQIRRAGGHRQEWGRFKWGRQMWEQWEEGVVEGAMEMRSRA